MAGLEFQKRTQLIYLNDVNEAIVFSGALFIQRFLIEDRKRKGLPLFLLMVNNKTGSKNVQYS